IIQSIVFVIDNCKSGDCRMLGEPFQHFLASRALRLIGAHVDEWLAPVFCGEYTYRVTSPGGRKHHFCVGSFEQPLETYKKLLVDDVGKLAQVWSLVAIQH